MKHRLLVVDDEVLVARTLRRVLAADYEVEGEACAADALARFRRGERFDVVLIDVVLPDLDGRALFQELAKVDAEQARRVLFITGTSTDEGILGFLESAPVRWLTKPFSIETLREELARVVASAPSAPAARAEE
jgi:DNA-binding response OmpR family regulator